MRTKEQIDNFIKKHNLNIGSGSNMSMLYLYDKEIIDENLNVNKKYRDGDC